MKNLNYNEISKITGSLGKPLGEIVTIEGKVVDNNPRLRENEGKILLNVIHVNNEKLKNPITLEFKKLAWVNIPDPQIGKNFKFIGYETGEMQGIPDKAFNYISRVATSGFSFKLSFIVLKEEN
jgi:hypothetical protein